MVSTTSKRSTTPSEDVISERHLRKRLAARVRQQRCRARKREAKLAKAQREVQVKAPRPSILHHHHHHHQIVRGPVLIRSPPRMSMPLLHHPTSPFIMYPRRAPPSFPPPGGPPPSASPPAAHWQQQPPQQPRSPPMTGRPIITSVPYPSRPLHQEVMTGSALTLGIQSPPTTNSHSHHHHPHHRHYVKPVRSPPSPILHQHSIPRVSPVSEGCSSNSGGSNKNSSKTVLLMPELDHTLERSEEAAIDAMLSLGRSPSKMAAV